MWRLIETLRVRWLMWRCRDRTFQSLAESYLVLLKSARRCAHDLDHATSFLEHGSWQSHMLNGRAKFWLAVFSPTGVKDYKLSLHEEIDSLDLKVVRLKALLVKHGIDIPNYITDDEAPF